MAGTTPFEKDGRRPRLEVVAPSELAGRATAFFGDAVRTALTERERCSIALSGGSTPAPMFRALAAMDLDWMRVDVFQVDERAAPDGHPERNRTLIERELRDRVVGRPPRLHPMPVTDDDLEAAADRYAADLEGVCGRPPVLDVVHLGLGDDGHTASLVPSDPVLEVRDRWVSTTQPYKGYRRMTLTYPALENARVTVFLVAGAEKAAALAGMLAGDRSMPAGRLKLADAVVFADPAAARLVSASR